MVSMWIIEKLLSLFPAYRAAREEEERRRHQEQEEMREAYERGYPDRSK